MEDGGWQVGVGRRGDRGEMGYEAEMEIEERWM